MPASAGAAEDRMSDMRPEDMKRMVDRDLEYLDFKNADLQANKGKDRQAIEDRKMQALSEIYEMMESIGVDPNDPESVRMFLEVLERQNPDLLQMIQTALTVLEPSSPPDTPLGIPPVPDMAEPLGMPPGQSAGSVSPVEEGLPLAPGE